MEIQMNLELAGLGKCRHVEWHSCWLPTLTITIAPVNSGTYASANAFKSIKPTIKYPIDLCIICRYQPSSSNHPTQMMAKPETL